MVLYLVAFLVGYLKPLENPSQYNTLGKSPNSPIFRPHYPTGSGANELSVSDLLAGLGSNKGSTGAARKALERMHRRAVPESAPLPKPVRERAARKAGYEETKKDVGKWSEVVQANRRAPSISFTKRPDIPKVNSTAALTAGFVPESAMEVRGVRVYWG